MSTIKKDPILAGVLSFLVPGLGQMYVGKFGRGAILFILYIIGWFVFVFPAIIIWIIAIWDAYKTAKESKEEVLKD